MADEQTTYSGAAVEASPDEDTELVYDIARSLYEQQARTRGFQPQPEPYCPSWCFDYARISIRIINDWHRDN